MCTYIGPAHIRHVIIIIICTYIGPAHIRHIIIIIMCTYIGPEHIHHLKYKKQVAGEGSGWGGSVCGQRVSLREKGRGERGEGGCVASANGGVLAERVGGRGVLL